MENQPQMPTANSPQTAEIQQSITDSRPKANSLLIILLSILLLISCVIAGFFAYQTQKLAEQLLEFRNQELATPISTSTYEPGTEPEPIPLEVLTKDWKTYTNTKANYFLKYPVSGWKALNTGVVEEKEAEQDSTYVSLIYQPDISKAAHELVFIITPSIPETDKDKLNQTKEIGNNYLADCWITEDNGYEFCWLKNTAQKGYLNINFGISKDENFNNMIDQILSTFKFTD
jgi:hypothetical protein